MNSNRTYYVTSVIPVFTRSSSQEPLFGLFAFASVNISSPRGCHCTSLVSRKGFSSSQVAYYPNYVSSFQLPLLLRSGDVHPNPGPPSGIVSFESRRDGPDLRGLRTFCAKAHSIVNKVNLLELEMYQRNYDLIILTGTHLDHSILGSEIFPSHYTVFRKDRKINGRHGGGLLIAVRDYITVSLRPTHPCDSEMLFIDVLVSYNQRITIGVFYRPPRSDIKPLEDPQNLIQGLDSIADLILVVDFNLPEIKWSCNRSGALQQCLNHALLIDIIQTIS